MIATFTSWFRPVPRQLRALWRSFVQALTSLALLALAAVPFAVCFVVGLLVSLALWWAAAAMAGYRAGRIR